MYNSTCYRTYIFMELNKSGPYQMCLMCLHMCCEFLWKGETSKSVHTYITIILALHNVWSSRFTSFIPSTYTADLVLKLYPFLMSKKLYLIYNTKIYMAMLLWLYSLNQVTVCDDCETLIKMLYNNDINFIFFELLTVITMVHPNPIRRLVQWVMGTKVRPNVGKEEALEFGCSKNAEIHFSRISLSIIIIFYNIF